LNKLNAFVLWGDFLKSDIFHFKNFIKISFQVIDNQSITIQTHFSLFEKHISHAKKLIKIHGSI